MIGIWITKLYDKVNNCMQKIRYEYEEKEIQRSWSYVG